MFFRTELSRRRNQQKKAFYLSSFCVKKQCSQFRVVGHLGLLCESEWHSKLASCVYSFSTTLLTQKRNMFVDLYNLSSGQIKENLIQFKAILVVQISFHDLCCLFNLCATYVVSILAFHGFSSWIWAAKSNCRNGNTHRVQLPAGLLKASHTSYCNFLQQPVGFVFRKNLHNTRVKE